MKMEGPSRRVAQPLPINGGGGSGRRMRKPLSDCTNAARNSSQSSSSASASVLKPQTEPNFSNPQSNVQLIKKFSKVTARNPSSAVGAPAFNPPSPPPPPPKSSSAAGRGKCETLDPHTVRMPGRAAQKTKTKAKAVMVPVSISPEKRIKVFRDKLYQNKESGVSKSCAMPKKRKQHSKRELDDTKKALEDYIQQQRSYYAEIDAFELSEEEVDSKTALD